MMKKFICFISFFFVWTISLNAQTIPSELKNCNDIVAYANETYQQIKTIKADLTKSMDDEIMAARMNALKKIVMITREGQESPDDFEVRKTAEKNDINTALEGQLDNIKTKYEQLIVEKTADLEAKLLPLQNNTLSIPAATVRVMFTQYDAKTQRYNYILADGDEMDIFYEWYIDVSAIDPNVQKELYQKVKQYVGAKGYVGYMSYGIIWNENEEKFIKKLKSAGVKQKDIQAIVSKLNTQICFPKTNTMHGHGFLCQVKEFDSVLATVVKQATPDKSFNIQITDSKTDLTAIAASLNSKPTVMVKLDLSQCDTTDNTADKPFAQCTNLIAAATPLVVSNGLFEE
ncbi:MAG: hypothetical protein J6W76_03960, partial [Spirochaetales bacterium]|nr:hypothetical protein [Spirochaetales bacterium]